MELKERIRHGWDVSAEGFSKIIVAPDFEEPGRSVWQELLLEKAPASGKLRILDVGTGPGLFAVILSMKGHQVTGIDISDEMLSQARDNAARYNQSPEFIRMESESLDFPEETFDLIVSRNVVWTMSDPEKTYSLWMKCLKKGGRVIVIDGGHPARKPGEPVEAPSDAYREKRKEEYIRRFHENPPISYSNYEEARGFKRDLALSYEERPQWDIETMKRLGYVNIQCDDITARKNYNEKLKFLYSNDYEFRLCGDKPF